MNEIYASNTVDEDGVLKRSVSIVKKKIDYYYTQMNSGEVCLDNLSKLSGQQIRLMIVMSALMNPKTNEVPSSKLETDKIIKSLGISRPNLAHLKVKLHHKDIGMIITHKGYRAINPEYFWRGSVADRHIMLEEIKDENKKNNGYEGL